MKPRQGSERNYEDFPDVLFALITSYRKAERRSVEHHASTLTLQVSSYLPGVALRKQHMVLQLFAAPPIIRATLLQRYQPLLSWQKRLRIT